MSVHQGRARARRGELHEKRWLAYSLAAGATGGFLADPAAATIQYTDIGDISVPFGYLQPLNLDGDAYNDIILANTFGTFYSYQYAVVPYGPGYLAAFYALGRNYVRALDADDPISAAAMSPYFYGALAYGYGVYSQFQYVFDKYIGFSFPSAFGVHYGWVRVDVDIFVNKLIIKDYAFENEPGVGILAGATTSGAPVPGDADGDGDVDLDDYDVLSGNMYTAVAGGFADGDFDEDGDVDFEDFVIQALNFGDYPAAEETVTELPEPGMLGFLAAGAGGLMFYRRRRGSGRP